MTSTTRAPSYTPSTKSPPISRILFELANPNAAEARTHGVTDDRTFIESQFPIARLSAESYKERKANLGQTLTGLGKWWGRKPLILVRASILGLLMPASRGSGKGP